VRTSLAFLLAPGMVPLVLAAELRSLATTDGWFGVFLVVAAAVSYTLTFLVAAPLLLYSWTKGFRSVGVTSLIGAAVGVVGWLAFGVATTLLLGNSPAYAALSLLQVSFLKGLLWPAVPCAVMVAVLVWCIARPDKRFAIAGVAGRPGNHN